MSSLLTNQPPKLIRITDTQHKEEFSISGVNLVKVDSQSTGVSVSWYVVRDKNAVSVDPILNEFLEDIVSVSEAAIELERLEGLKILEKAEMEDEMDNVTTPYQGTTEE